MNKGQTAHRVLSALDRLLDPGNAWVTLQTPSHAAHAGGRDLRIELGGKLSLA